MSPQSYPFLAKVAAFVAKAAYNPPSTVNAPFLLFFVVCHMTCHMTCTEYVMVMCTLSHDLYKIFTMETVFVNPYFDIEDFTPRVCVCVCVCSWCAQNKASA